MTFRLAEPSAEEWIKIHNAINTAGLDIETDDLEYKHLAPLRRHLLLNGPADLAEIGGSVACGWQVVVRDVLGNAVVDTTDSNADAYTPLRRGALADRYIEALQAIEEDRAADDDCYDLEVVEIRGAACCALWVHKDDQSWFYPVMIQGELAVQRCLDVKSFRAEVSAGLQAG